MSILKEIVDNKIKEVSYNKSKTSVKELEKSSFFERTTFSFKHFIKNKGTFGLIAEFKKQSPSKGVINADANVDEVTKGYFSAGASGLSILTDEKYFGGKNEDLTPARKINQCPIIRKDFIVNEYQIIEAKSIGADAILLIASILDKKNIQKFTDLAHSLGLEVLLEIHNEEELKKSFIDNIDMLGVNNRNLNTFSTDINTSKNLYKQIPQDCIKISESGIENPKAIIELKNIGFDGFLIGGYFMQHAQPDIACKTFVDEVNKLLNS